MNHLLRTALTTAGAVSALVLLAAEPAVAEHHAAATSAQAGGAAVASAANVPSSPQSTIRGPHGDLAFAGAKGLTITGLWARADHRRLDQFMLYLPSIDCSGGFTAVDLHRVLEIVPKTFRSDGTPVLYGNSVSKRGRFSASGVQEVSYGGGAEVSGTIEESIDGTLRGDRVDGHYTAEVSLFDSAGTAFATCSSGRVAWSGRSGVGRYFVGGSWINPVYVERSANGKRLTQIRIGATLACEQDQFWQTWTQFGGRPIQAGRFSLDSDTNDPFGSEQLHDVTTGQGTFHGDQVRGTFSEDATFTSPEGAVTDHCVQEPIEWKAYSTAR